jgi:hypothetical protein
MNRERTTSEYLFALYRKSLAVCILPSAARAYWLRSSDVLELACALEGSTYHIRYGTRGVTSKGIFFRGELGDAALVFIKVTRSL